MTVVIEIVNEANDEVLEALRRLVPQLSKSAPRLSMDALEEIVESDASILLVARQDGRIVGTLTVAIFRIPSGVRAWIEDVIVDDDVRGQGVGAMLTQVAIGLSKKVGARTIDLTSNPSREAANRLYQRQGFERRETNVYRFSLEG